MASYVVLTPPDAGRLDERAVLIRDGFAFWALILPFLWLLWFRLWFQAAVVVLAGVAIALASEVWPQWGSVVIVSSILISIYVALEGNAMRIAKRERQGWTAQAVVVAPNRATAEEIYFAEEDAGSVQTGSSASAASQKAALAKPLGVRTAPATSGPALGLLDLETRN